MLVGAITLVGFLLRLRSLGNSLYGDELATYYTVTGHGLGRTFEIVRSDQELTPPLFYVLSWLATQLGGTAEMLRLPSFVAGTATIPLTYLVGARTLGRTAAVVAAAIVAFDPFLIFYSTEARAYALLIFLLLVSTLALLKALDSARWRWWLVYAVASCAAMYTHYTAIFVLVAQALWAFWAGHYARRGLLVANLAAAVGFVPWLHQLHEDDSSPCSRIISRLAPFNFHEVRVDLGRWVIGHPYRELSSIPGSVALGLLGVGIAVAVIGAGWRLAARNAGARTRMEGPLLVLLLALAAPVGAAIASAVGNSVYTPRNLISSSPGVALTIAALVIAARPALRMLAATLLIAGFAIGGIGTLSSANERTDYTAAARFVDRVGAPGTPVVEVPFPTPGPVTPMEAALARVGGSAPARHPVLRLHYPAQTTEMRFIARTGSACRGALLPPSPPQAIARLASGLGAGRSLFFAQIGDAPIAAFRFFSKSAQAAFLQAIAPRFRYVGVRRFPGFTGYSVYVFRDTAGGR